MAKKQTSPGAPAAPAEPPKTATKQGKQRKPAGAAGPSAVAVEPTHARASEPPEPPEYGAIARDIAVDECLEHIASGGTVLEFAREHGIKVPTMYKWLEVRREDYDKARADRAHVLADKIIDVASEAVPSTAMGSYDSAAVADKRLRIDTMKWLASKLLPKTYGDRLEVDAKVEHSFEDKLAALAGVTVPKNADVPRL